MIAILIAREGELWIDTQVWTEVDGMAIGVVGITGTSMGKIARAMPEEALFAVVESDCSLLFLTRDMERMYLSIQKGGDAA